MAKTDSASPVKYRINVYPGMSKIVPHPPEDVIARILEQALWQVQTDKNGMRTLEYLDVCFYDEDVLKQFVFPTGFVAALRGDLKKAGHQVKVRERRKFGDRFQIADEVFSSAVGPEKGLFDTMKRSTQGVVEVSGFSQTVEFIEETIRLFPKANILVLADDRKMATDVRYNLSKGLRRKIPIRRQGLELPKVKLVVSTYHRIHFGDVDWWDVILLADPVSATQERGCPMMADLALGTNRIYAFLNADQKLSRLQASRLESFAGPRILRRLDAHVDVDLLALVTPSCKEPGSELGLEWKQAAYWANDRRNDFVTSVAQAFETGQVRRLSRYGIRVKNGIPRIRGGKSPSVVVVAEGRRHAEELQKRLRSWPILTPSSSGSEMKKTTPAIATVSYLDEYGTEADVYIVASGDLTQLEAKSFLPERHTNKDSNCLVVDFKDEFSPLTFERAEQRFHLADRRHWKRYPASLKTPAVN